MDFMHCARGKLLRQPKIAVHIRYISQIVIIEWELSVETAVSKSAPSATCGETAVSDCRYRPVFFCCRPVFDISQHCNQIQCQTNLHVSKVRRKRKREKQNTNLHVSVCVCVLETTMHNKLNLRN